MRSALGHQGPAYVAAPYHPYPPYPPPTSDPAPPSATAVSVLCLDHKGAFCEGNEFSKDKLLPQGKCLLAAISSLLWQLSPISRCQYSKSLVGKEA